jgi:hypothetical protein
MKTTVDVLKSKRALDRTVKHINSNQNVSQATIARICMVAFFDIRPITHRFVRDSKNNLTVTPPAYVARCDD